MSDFNKRELKSQGKILIIDEEVSNHDIIDGFLMLLGYSNRENNAVYVQDASSAWKEI